MATASTYPQFAVVQYPTGSTTPVMYGMTASNPHQRWQEPVAAFTTVPPVSQPTHPLPHQYPASAINLKHPDSRPTTPPTPSQTSAVAAGRTLQSGSPAPPPLPQLAVSSWFQPKHQLALDPQARTHSVHSNTQAPTQFTHPHTLSQSAPEATDSVAFPNNYPAPPISPAAFPQPLPTPFRPTGYPVNHPSYSSASSLTEQPVSSSSHTSHHSNTLPGSRANRGKRSTPGHSRQPSMSRIPTDALTIPTDSAPQPMPTLVLPPKDQAPTQTSATHSGADQVVLQPAQLEPSIVLQPYVLQPAHLEHSVVLQPVKPEVQPSALVRAGDAEQSASPAQQQNLQPAKAAATAAVQPGAVHAVQEQQLALPAQQQRQPEEAATVPPNDYKQTSHQVEETFLPVTAQRAFPPHNSFHNSVQHKGMPNAAAMLNAQHGQQGVYQIHALPSPHSEPAMLPKAAAPVHATPRSGSSPSMLHVHPTLTSPGPIIQTLPTFSAAMNPAAVMAARPGKFSTPLWDMSSDVPIFLCGTFFQPCLFAENYWRFHGDAYAAALLSYLICTFTPCCLAPKLRKDIRKKYGIDADSDWEDFCVHIWCHPCALCQEARQLKYGHLGNRTMKAVKFIAPPELSQSMHK